MSLQYSGGPIIHRLVTPTSRQDLLNAFTQALLDAGWATISGTPGSSNDVVQESAAQNSGAKIRSHMHATGSLSTYHAIRALTGTTDSWSSYCNPANTWRIICNKFFYLFFETTAANKIAIRSCVYGGTLYTPSFLAVNSGDPWGVIYGNGNADNDASGRQSIRTQIRPGQGSTGLIAGAIATNSATQNLSFNGWQGGIASGGSAADQGYQWEDGSLPVYEALISCAYPIADSETRIVGQMYDACMINYYGAGESTFAMDGHTWMVITDQPGINQSADSSLAMAIT